jgi:hypothetical protein
MNRKLLLSAAFAFAACASQSVQAHTIDWTSWTNATNSPTAGTASGTAGAVTVTYKGEVQSLQANYPSWNPASSYTGGTVSNAPLRSGGIIQLFGDTDATDTITFSHAVLNPVIAIWSLGQGGVPASFDFSQTPTFEAGGPSAEYGGGAITVSGNDVFGSEGNGVVQFTGTFTSITWTNPTYENWYGFTVGIEAPEPAAWVLMLVGFGGLGAAMRAARRTRLTIA